MSSATHCVPGKQVGCQDIISPNSMGISKHQDAMFCGEKRLTLEKTKAAKPKPHLMVLVKHSCEDTKAKELQVRKCQEELGIISREL